MSIKPSVPMKLPTAVIVLTISQDRIRLGNQLSNAFYIVYTSSAVSPNPQYTGKINMLSNTNQNVFLSYVTIYYMYNQSIPISSSASASILNATSQFLEGLQNLKCKIPSFVYSLLPSFLKPPLSDFDPRN